MKNTVIVSVINDLASDQRVHRTCQTLHEMGLKVVLVGRLQKKSTQLAERDYQTHRMKLWFEKGAKFYAEYNIRLFLYLLFHKYHILHSNDLDTLFANNLVKRIKGGTLVYDSHEYFVEVPELVARPKVKRIWENIEKRIFPKLKHVFTVNRSISKIYEKQYSVPVRVLRNVPILSEENSLKVKSREELGLPGDKKILLLQGAGINVDRGAEEMVEAMQWIDAMFLIVGSGDVIEVVKKRVLDLGLQNKVIFTGRVPFQELMAYTKVADFGVTLDKDTNLNYKYSLPNKLFDYIHADLPVIASNLIEVKNIIQKYQVGLVLSTHEPQQMAKEINEYLANDSLCLQAKQNLVRAKADLNWGEEKQVLIKEYESILG